MVERTVEAASFAERRLERGQVRACVAPVTSSLRSLCASRLSFSVRRLCSTVRAEFCPGKVTTVSTLLSCSRVERRTTDCAELARSDERFSSSRDAARGESPFTLLAAFLFHSGAGLLFVAAAPLCVCVFARGLYNLDR